MRGFFSIRKWFDNLSLQNKIQLQIQPVLIVLLSVATFFIYHQMKANIISNQAQRAKGVAMQVIDSANMLMVTGAISNPNDRQLMIRKIVEGQDLASLRLVRTDQVVRQFGPGLPEEHLDDPLVKQTIEHSVRAGKSIPYISIELVNGKPMLRAITPYIESHGFHGTDCLTCHHIAVGSSNGASDLMIDLSENFRGLNTTLAELIGGQAGLQLFLFFLIGWFSTLKSQQQRFELLAHYDTLTGLPNRALLNDRLSMAIAQTKRSGGKLAVGFMDLDEFKPVNDSYGHEAGDLLLIKVAERIVSTLRATDTLARLGGDEFVLLFSNISDEAECRHMLSRIMDSIVQPFKISGHDIRISTSIGVTLYPDDDIDADSLLRHADQAMYVAKEAGRNRFHFFDIAEDHHAHVRSEIRARVKIALKRKEFLLYYQPKVNLRTGQVVGLEALIRWQHPERGLLSPIEFLPMIENSDFEIRLSEWVVTEALRQLAAWRKQGLDVTVSVNIPARHLQSEGFDTFIASSITRETEVPADRLELEILETVALWDIDSVTRTMEACRELGVRFSIDDFGTGYASLAYLRRLPADTIKIDQVFVRDMLNDPDDLSIVEGVIYLADAFQKKVIAEGVETVAHGTMLLHMGCDLAQGYGIARPMAAEELPSWVRNFRADPTWIHAGNFRLSRQDTALVFAEAEHRRWITDLVAYVEGKSHVDPTRDTKECRFSEWLQGSGQLAYGDLTEFSAIDSIYEAMHALGKDLSYLCVLHRHSEARDRLPELFALMDNFIESLHRFIEII
jgi:diguanylate cyclase (GGDEF)-like protein